MIDIRASAMLDRTRMAASDHSTWTFPTRDFSFAHEAAQYILDNTEGKISDDALNAFVLCWGKATGRSLLNTQQQNRNRVVKYRKSWERYGDCRHMNA